MVKVKTLGRVMVVERASFSLIVNKTSLSPLNGRPRRAVEL